MKKKDSRPGSKVRAGSEKKQAYSAKAPRRPENTPKKREPDAVRSAPKPVAKEKVATSLPVEQVPARALKTRTGDLPAEQVPVILESSGAGDFHLIDSGNGLKLEQYGDYRIVRPEAQALWRPTLPERVWQNVDAVFSGDTDEDGMGRWRFPKTALGETWPLSLLGVDFLGRFTAFRHVGVFPEQIVHWLSLIHI